MDTRDEIMDIIGEVIRLETEVKNIKEAQIKPRQVIIAELRQRMVDAYLDRNQMRLPLNHDADITE